VAEVRGANTALDALRRCQSRGFDLGALVASRALATAEQVLRGAPVRTDVVVIDRAGEIIGRAG
jgi:cobalt-precorrin-5B (C1)-methyltransferase